MPSDTENRRRAVLADRPAIDDRASRECSRLKSFSTMLTIFSRRLSSGMGRCSGSCSAARISSISTETTRASSGVRSTGWSHGATRCISAPSKGPTARTCGSSLPAGTTWPAKSGLTVVGDAAHVMPPMGAGVNLAMLDAAELAEAIVAAANWRDAVCAQEQVMLDRARLSLKNVCAVSANGFTRSGAHTHCFPGAQAASGGRVRAHRARFFAEQSPRDGSPPDVYQIERNGARWRWVHPSLASARLNDIPRSSSSASRVPQAGSRGS